MTHLLVPLTLKSSSGSSSATGAPKSTTKTGCNDGDVSAQCSTCCVSHDMQLKG